MRSPCIATLNTARALLEHGILGEGARTLVDLRRCAADCGCDDWQSCEHAVQNAWREAAQAVPKTRPLPGSPAR